LAILISRQEKELFQLKKKSYSKIKSFIKNHFIEVDVLEQENKALRDQYEDLNNRLSKHLNQDLATHLQDK